VRQEPVVAKQAQALVIPAQVVVMQVQVLVPQVLVPQVRGRPVQLAQQEPVLLLRRF